MDRLEYRAVELRSDGATLTGTLIPYGVPSRIGGVFSETFRPGSVRWGAGVLANVQHGRDRPLARLGHGLTLTDGPDALRASVRMPGTQLGRDTRTLVEDGVLRGLSAEFRTIREDWPRPDERVIEEAELTGLAVVDDPGHDDALIDEVRAKITRANTPTFLLF